MKLTTNLESETHLYSISELCIWKKSYLNKGSTFEQVNISKNLQKCVSCDGTNNCDKYQTLDTLINYTTKEG